MICSLILLEAAEWLLEPKSISKRMNELIPKMEQLIWEKILSTERYSSEVLNFLEHFGKFQGILCKKCIRQRKVRLELLAEMKIKAKWLMVSQIIQSLVSMKLFSYFWTITSNDVFECVTVIKIVKIKVLLPSR